MYRLMSDLGIKVEEGIRGCRVADLAVDSTLALP